MSGKLGKWFLSIIGVLLSLIIIALFYLTSAPGERLLKGVLESKLSDALGQPVIITSLETNLSSRLIIDRFYILGDEKDSNSYVLSLDDLKIHYTLTALLNKELSINSISLGKLDINIKRDSLGYYNFPALNAEDNAAAPPAGESSYKLVLGSISIDTLIASYGDNLIGLNTSLGNCNVDVRRSEAGSYVYNVNINEIRSVYDNMPLFIESLAANGSYDNKQLVIEKFNAGLSGLYLTGAARADMGIDTTITASIMLEGNPESFLATIRPVYSLPELRFNRGISFSAYMGGNLNSPNAIASLSIPQIQSKFGRLDELLLKLSYENETITIDSMRVGVFNGMIKAQGSARADSQFSGVIDIDIANIDMARAWQTAYKEKSPYEGQINGRIRAVIPDENIGNWQIESNIEARRARYLGKNLPDLYVNTQLKNGLGKFRIHHPDFEINLNSSFENSNMDGAFTVDIQSIKSLSEMLEIEDLDGRIYASGDLGGTLESPEIDATISMTNVNYSNFPVDELDAEISYRNDSLYISKAYFSGRLDSIDSSKPLFGVDSLAGSIVYSGWAKGRLDSISAELNIELGDLGFKEWAIDSGELHIASNGGNIIIDNSFIEKNSQTLEIDGGYDIDNSTGKLNLFLRADKIDTAGAGAIRSEFQIKENKSILLGMVGRDIDISRLGVFYSDSLITGGKLNFDLSLDGGLSNPAAGLNIRAVNPSFDDMAIDSVIADISISEKTLSVPLLGLYKGENSLKSTCVVTLERDSLGYLNINNKCPVKGRVFCNDWDMSILNPFFRQQAEVSGTSSLNIEFDGSLGAPQITGLFEIDRGNFILLPESDSVTNLNMQIAIDDSMLTLNRFQGIVNNMPFEARGNVTFSKDGDYYSDLLFNIPDIGYMSVKGGYAEEKINLELEISDLDLSLLEPFVPSIKKFEGELNSKVLIAGGINDPSISGDLLIRQLYFQPEILPSPFTDGVVKIRFDQQTVNLDSLFFRHNNGSLMASGFLIHDYGEIINMDFSTMLNSLKINQPGEYELLIQSGTLHYWGEKENFLLDGDIQFGETRFLKKIGIQSILSWISSVEKANPELPTFLQQTKINIRIRESDKLWVDNNLAHIRLHSEIGIIGSPIQPNITGRLSIDEGYVLYLDRKFKVKRGVAFFNDPFRLNPEIDFLAEARVRSYQALESQIYDIKIEITGPLDELNTNIYSEPPLERTDIMALLTLGATTSQLAGKDSESGDVSTKDILLERAAMLSSQRISGYVSQKMGTFLGLDEVSVEGNLFKFDDTWGPQLLASKKLSERMSLTYKTTVGHMNDQSIKLDYKLTRRFSLEGQTDRQGRSSLDLIFGLRFR